MYRASSEARKTTALLTSTGSTQPTGSRLRAASTFAASAAVGFSTRGHNLANVASFRDHRGAHRTGVDGVDPNILRHKLIGQVRINPTTACLLAV